MVEGLLVIKATTRICKGCILGKHSEHKFDWGKESQQSEILGLIHSDIRGPIPITSLNGYSRILNFIDYFSRYTWATSIKKKSDVLEKFIELKALIGNASRKNIKTLRYDNGGEYVSNEFLPLCSKSSIQIQPLVPYTPQHSGVVERKN